jgi:glycine reductase
MVKEIDKAGIPIAHITAMTPIAQVTGSNRIIQGVTINNPCSDINLPVDQQEKMQKKFITRALAAISTDITDQTFF